MVDKQGLQMPGSRTAGTSNGCERFEKYRDKQLAGEDQPYMKVFLSPPPPNGWSSEPKSIGGRSVIAGVRQEPLLCRCGARDDPSNPTNWQASGCCTFDFETETFTDGDGNRWDPKQFNELVE